MRNTKKESNTYMFCTAIILGICILFRVFVDVLEYIILPGRWTSVMDLLGGWITVALAQCITLGIFYMLVPLANALLYRKSNSRTAHIVVGVGYLVGGLVLLPVAWVFVLLLTAEGTNMPYDWRVYSFAVPYVICYLVGIAQLIYDIVKK